MITCIHSQSSSSKLRQTTSFLSACFPSLLPLAFYFYSFPHSSTLFLSALVLFFILLSTIPFRSRNWTIWLEADIKNLLPLHSVLSFHVNERNVIQNILPSSLQIYLLLQQFPPQRKSFIPFSPHIFFQFQDIEHEKDSIMIEEVENGKRGVNLTKKALSTE